MIYHLAGHEILNKTVYFVCHFNLYFLRKWRKCSRNSEKQKFQNANLRDLFFGCQFSFWGCGFVRICGRSLICHELLDKTYISAYH